MGKKRSIPETSEFPSHTLGPAHEAMRNCPNKNEHDYGPDGYVMWHDWAERRLKTHVQLKCTCGFFVIWRKK